jgi:hypothetical protein
MSGEQRAGRRPNHGPVGTAISTSLHGNATAFGFSITITATFGAIQRAEGTPSVPQLLLFGAASAAAVGLLSALVTRGFRERVGSAPEEVVMLGTALNVVSVVVSVAIALLAAAALSGTAAWIVAAFAACGAYVLVESSEILLAERVQRRRGDPEAEREQGA